jgi:hypothetical protein
VSEVRGERSKRCEERCEKLIVMRNRFENLEVRGQR